MDKIFTKIPPRDVLATVVGVCGGVGVISAVTYLAGVPWLIAPFGASAVLIYGATASPLARPRNLFGGHLLAAVIGVTCYQLLGECWYSITLAVTATILITMFTDTVHPPSGATAIIAILSHANYLFVLFPVLAGLSLMFVVAVLANKISPNRQYPVRKT